MDKLGGITGQVEWGTQTSFVQSMRAGRIRQHMKLTGGKGIIAVIGSRRMTGLRETQAVVKWQETAEYSEQRRPDWGCCREDRS